MKRFFGFTAIVLAASTISSSSCAPASHTAADREALFDYIIDKTRSREAFSAVKNRKLNFDPVLEMEKFRGEMIGAATDDALFDVLMKISNARRDRHLRVRTVPGGLNIRDTETLHAPIQFMLDYGSDAGRFFFVSDYAEDIGSSATDAMPSIGDKLIAVNGEPVDRYIEKVRPYYRYSTVAALWWKLAQGLPTQTRAVPVSLESAAFVCELERDDGATYTLSLAYRDPDSIRWNGFYKGHGAARYPEYQRVIDLQCFDVYRHAGSKTVLLVDFYGFRENLITDVDSLISYAVANDLLGHDIIWDATRSRGGSKGAYAIQRLSPRPFKTTFGNVRISDITEPFIAQKRQEYEAKALNDNGVAETVDSGAWLMDWLETDVRQAMRDGADYSNNVPFKSAHLPKDSDGILQPADVHFTGRLVCFFSPHGGSHLDQFASMIRDNNLGFSIGMPTGGYSNTWEWFETLRFPTTGKPVVEFMWSMGHTIRPNGEVLEGNPAQVDEYVPLTRNNYLSYYENLLERAYALLNRT